jgi:hypothetical protein
MRRLSMRVTIYHNTAADGSGRHIGYDGYEPGHPLVPVFTYTTVPADPQAVAEAAFEAFNADPGMLTGTQRELAEQYRARSLRSLSPGDVVRAGDSTLAVTRPAGWIPVTGPLNVVRTGMHGTHPLPAPPAPQAPGPRG